MHVDEALDIVGGYKRWHLTAFVLLSISGLLPICLQSMGIIFIGWVPPYHCSIPPDQMLNESLPRDENGEYESCMMYVNTSIDNSTTECNDGYYYYNEGYSTIVTEFELVCKSDFLSELSQFLYLIGSTFAEIIGSYISDMFGRKKVHIISHMCIAVVGTVVAFAPNYTTFVIARSMCGMISVVATNTGFTMLMELFGQKKRAFAGVGVEFVWVVFFMAPCLLAFFVQNWRIYQLVASLTSLIWVMYIWVITESVPWLVAKHRYSEAEDILMKMARLNGMKNIPRINLRITSNDTQNETTVSLAAKAESSNHKEQESVTEDGSEELNTVPISDLFCDSKLRLHLLMANIFAFANTMIYYSLTLSTPSLGPNRFLSFFIMGIVELPAYVVCMIVVDRIGRRIPQAVFFIIAGIPLGAAGFVPKETANGTDLSPLIFTLVMIGKFGITGSFAVMVLYVRELFPTTLRSSSVAWGGIGGTIGAMLAPVFAYTARHLFWLPNVIYAVSSITAGILTMFLPETKDKPLPLTTDDVHKIYYGKGNTGPGCEYKDQQIHIGDKSKVTNLNQNI